MHTLAGKVAVVTGGSKGIGLAVARQLLEHGVHTVITGRSSDALEAARQTLDGVGSAQLVPVQADVRQYPDGEAAIAAAVGRFGGLDILVNNAGVGLFAPVAEMTPAQWASVIDTNLTGVFNLTHAALPHLKQRGGGYIINVSSLAGKNAFPGAAAYCATKAGLNAFSEALMQEVRYDNIRVSYVMPGSVATGFVGDAAAGADWKSSPEEIAEVVLDLLRLNTRSLASRIEIRPSRPKKA